MCPQPLHPHLAFVCSPHPTPPALYYSLSLPTPPPNLAGQNLLILWDRFCSLAGTPLWALPSLGRPDDALLLEALRSFHPGLLGPTAQVRNLHYVQFVSSLGQSSVQEAGCHLSRMHSFIFLQHLLCPHLCQVPRTPALCPATLCLMEATEKRQW